MSQVPSKIFSPHPDLLRVQDVYSHLAEMSVDMFNRTGEITASLLGINFMEDGSFECTLIDPVYVHESLKTPTGRIEMRRFVEGLLHESAMREDMKTKGFRPADIAVFITEILMTPKTPMSGAPTEGILVVMHTPESIYRGFSPIFSEPTRHAVLGEMALDPVVQTEPTDTLKAAAKAFTPADVTGGHKQHDLHLPAEKIQ